MTKAKKTLKIKLNTKIYPHEAIYGACYVFIDRAYIFLNSPKKDTVEVSLKAKENLSPKEFEKLKGEFNNELLSYVQRINITKHNKKIRDYIVERALYASIEDDSSNSFDNDFDDPLGIAVPWEEKYGNNK